MNPSRRRFLVTTSGFAAALVGCGRKTDRPIAGGFVDDAGARGHALRDRAALPAPRRTVRIPVVIVGGGIAGLSAAWQLDRRGFRDFVLLEMESQPGGNARWGEGEGTAYPWAAHYVPVPGPRATLARELFTEFGVLRDGQWDETMLVFSLKERIHRWGRWHEGFEEVLAETAADRAEFLRFRERMAELRATGEFTIPSALGVRPSSLDTLSMRQWLDREGFRSSTLRWYVDYSCRDDYGALAADTSAWAGVHYFASRAEERGPLTWPEGNGWIVKRLLARLDRYVETAVAVHRVELRGTGARVLAGEVEYLCDSVVWAAPSFLSPHLVEGAQPVDFTYSPWVTANLSLDRLPDERRAELAWDNVIMDSPSLGYVAADHQALRSHREQSVWTYYWALAHQPARAARAALLEPSWHGWTELILSDLERAHPDIRRCVARIDVLRMGHAMVRPTPGFLTAPARQRLRETAGPVVYANSDVSGLSLFEEAQYCGVHAADAVLERISRST